MNRLELINSILDLCVSLSCVFAIALAYQAAKDIERVDKRIDKLSGKFDKVADGRDVGADDRYGE